MTTIRVSEIEKRGLATCLHDALMRERLARRHSEIIILANAILDYVPHDWTMRDIGSGLRVMDLSMTQWFRGKLLSFEDLPDGIAVFIE